MKPSDKEARRSPLVLKLKPQIHAALKNLAKETRRSMEEIGNDILENALALPPDPTVETLRPVMRYLAAVLQGKHGPAAETALLLSLVQAAKDAGY